MNHLDATGRAERLIEIGRPGDAIALLATYLASEPQDAHALRLLALAHLSRADHAAAQQAAEAALVAEPDAEWSHRLAAIVAGRTGRFPLALEHAEQAVRLDPESWQARVVLSQALVNRRSARRAQEQARQAVVLAPQEAATHMQLSIASAARRQGRAAREALAQALKLDPNAPEVLEYRAYRDVEEGRLGQAASSIRQSLQLDPTSMRGQDNLARMVIALIMRLTACLLAASVALMILLGAELAGSIPTYWPRAATGVVAVIVAGVMGWLTLRVLPSPVRRHALMMPATFKGQQRAVMILVAVLVISFACLAFLPASAAHIGSVGVLLTFADGIALSLVNVVQELWHRASRLVR